MTYQRNETVELEEPLKGLDLGKRLVDCENFLSDTHAWNTFIISQQRIKDQSSNPNLPIRGTIDYNPKYGLGSEHGCIAFDGQQYAGQLSIIIDGNGNPNKGYTLFTIQAREHDLPRREGTDEDSLRESMDDHINTLIGILKGEQI